MMRRVPTADLKLMKLPSRHQLSSLPATPGWISNGWPRTISTMEQVGFSRPFRSSDLIRLCRWAGLCDDRRRGGGIAKAALGRLAGMAARNGRSNRYHHAGHFAHVMMAAAVLACRARLDRESHGLLVLAALVHDLDHHGRRGKHHPQYAQERWSARVATRVLARHGADARLGRRLARLICATAMTDDPFRHAILASDPVARLLTDADIFASLFYRRDVAMRLTRHLKLEQGIGGRTGQMLDSFVARMEHEGLASHAGRELLREVVAWRHPRRTVLTGKGWE